MAKNKVVEDFLDAEYDMSLKDVSHGGEAAVNLVVQLVERIKESEDEDDEEAEVEV